MGSVLMPKPEKRPVPPGHRVYPRGTMAKPEAKPAVNGDRRAAAWTRAVPPDRTFPRG
jgi:hypothetical protein